MLESVTLINFQKHKKLKITLDPKVTVIVGTTDAGKSSIIRAIRFATLNQPTGSNVFIKHGESFTKVILKIDGRKIIRHKGKTKNAYYLDDKKYVAFGSGKVPDPIKKFMNIEDINFRGQLTPHFWFSETPGQIAKNINDLVQLTLLDKCLKTISKRVKTTKIEVDLVQDQLKKSTEAIEQLKWVEECRMEFDNLIKLFSRLKTIEYKKRILADFIIELEQIQSRVDKAGSLKSNADKLNKIISELETNSEQIKNLKAILKGIETNKPKKPLPTIGEMEADLKEASIVYQKMIELEQTLQKIEKLTKTIKKNKTKVQELKTYLEKVQKVCPVCLQPIQQT